MTSLRGILAPSFTTSLESREGEWRKAALPRFCRTPTTTTASYATPLVEGDNCMAVRSFRSRIPPQTREKENEKPKKKRSLEEVCLDMKQKILAERMEAMASKRREEARAEEDEVMRMTYGPRWKESAA